MNTLFAILYYGDSQIRFEGANGVSSDGLIVDKAGIEGWWSAPDLKVDVTERASGNGAHDVSVDSILYATRTVTVHFDVIGDVHGEVLDAVTKVSQANGMPVRLRVVDDKSDTFVSGFIRPQFGPGWNERHQTGTLTIVCPRPERLAWSTLQTQLFPVSMVQGGLKYSTTHELVSSWTGTPDASTSTLSQDGHVVATNLFPYPKPTSLVPFAEILRTSTSFPSSGGMLMQQTSDVSTGAGAGAFVKMALPSLAAGTYHVLATMSPSASVKPPNYGGRKMICIANEFMAGLAGDSTVSKGVRSFTFTADGSTSYYLALFAGDGSGDASMSVLWQNIIVLSDADWSAMQALGVEWFDGDSYPVPMGKGLSYPLKYGTAGSSSNVALLLNHGSSKAYPVLTVTGNFPNGVQIQWGGNALQYDGAIGAVPLILDSRSQTASMGGVDVSRNLSRRDFPMVPAAGSVSLRLMSAGTGWVTAVCRDTYI